MAHRKQVTPPNKISASHSIRIISSVAPQYAAIPRETHNVPAWTWVKNNHGSMNSFLIISNLIPQTVPRHFSTDTSRHFLPSRTTGANISLNRAVSALGSLVDWICEVEHWAYCKASAHGGPVISHPPKANRPSAQ